MNTENVKEKIERIKILSTLFLKDNIKVFIKDIYHSYYFGNIVLINDDSIIIKCFSPPNTCLIITFNLIVSITAINS